jgi:putative DNA primase/helicase
MGGMPNLGEGLRRDRREQKRKLSPETVQLIEKQGRLQRALGEIAHQICDQLYFKRVGEQIYYFKNIIWEPLEKTMDLRRVTQDFLDHHRDLNDAQWTEIHRIIKCGIEEYPELDTSDPSIQHLICFRNGIYDVMKDTMIPHSHEYPFINFINFDFHPEDKGCSPVFDAYVDSASHGDSRIKRRLLQWMAYCTSNLPNLKKIALVMGEPNSGKSTYGNLIRNIVGEGNCSSFNFTGISKFSHQAMFGKLLGLSTDMNGEKISAFASEWLKMQTGGDEVYAEIKHNSKGYSYVSRCRYIIASNYRPDFNDEALDDRMLIIPMPKSLSGGEINRNLLSDIKSEMQYVFCELFEVLREFIENDMQFEDIGDWEFYEPQYYTNQESEVSSFFRLRCYYEETSRISRTDLYESYQLFCADHGYKAKTKRSFCNDFKQIAREHDIRDDTNDGRKYKGLATCSEDMENAPGTWEVLQE